MMPDNEQGAIHIGLSYDYQLKKLLQMMPSENKNMLKVWFVDIPSQQIIVIIHNCDISHTCFFPRLPKVDAREINVLTSRCMCLHWYGFVIQKHPYHSGKPIPAILASDNALDEDPLAG
jgi:hypothetical protein